MEKDYFISEIVVFKPSQGCNEFEFILDGEHDTVWITEQQLTELFGKAHSTIGEHIPNIYIEGELGIKSTWRNFLQVQTEGDRKVKFSKTNNTNILWRFNGSARFKKL